MSIESNVLFALEIQRDLLKRDIRDFCLGTDVAEK